MNQIENMTIEEILDNIGINITDRGLQLISNNDEEIKRELEEYEKRMVQREIDPITRQLLDGLKVRQILCSHADRVNKKYLVLLTLYNSQKELEEKGVKLKKENVKVTKNYIKKAIKLIGSEDFSVIDLSFDEGTKQISDVRVINSRELAESISQGKGIKGINKPSKKQMERIKEINREIGLENLAQIIATDDVKKVISTDPDIGEAIFVQISWNAVENFKKSHPETKFEQDEEQFIPEELQLVVLQSEEYRKAFSEAIIKNCKHIDIDKLLLLSSYRFIRMLEHDTNDEVRISEYTEGEKVPEEEYSKEETIRVIEDLIREMSKKIKKGTKIKVDNNGQGEEEAYSYEQLEKELRRFRNGKYIKEKETQQLREKLINNEMLLGEADDDTLRTITFEEGDFVTLIKNSQKNVIYLIDENVITQEDITEVLETLGNCSEELFSKIQEKAMLSDEEILRLFQEGILTVENLSIIKKQETIEKLRQLAIEGLQKSYQNISKNQETEPEELEQFNRYIALYKMLNITGKTEEQIEESANELIISFEEELDSELLEKLYQFGVIPLGTAVDWGVDLIEMLSHNSIKPTDLKDLYNRQIIQINAIINVLIHGELDYEEKLDLIYSTFDGESEEDYQKREELVEIIGIGEAHKEEGTKNARTNTSETRTRYREFITDPHARWKLISLLDKDYSKKFLPTEKAVTDGHRVFLLPNQGKIVIEKMHEKRKGKKVGAYGSATYIMSTEEFFKKINDIIIGGAINRTKLRELSEEDCAIKIIHSSAWGETIKKYFEINEENQKYTQEDIEAINAAIERVESSRRERT